jgi:hypothetical protein
MACSLAGMITHATDENTEIDDRETPIFLARCARLDLHETCLVDPFRKLARQPVKIPVPLVHVHTK